MYAIPLLDTCIRMAHKDLCAIRWTAEILDEAERNLIKRRADAGSIQLPETALAPYGIEAISPDDFLLNVLTLYPKDTAAVLQEQAAALKRPPLTVDDVLKALAKNGAPNFAREASTVIEAAL